MRTDKIELTDSKGDVVVSITADPTHGGGVWIHGKNGQKIAIYSWGDQMAIGFYKNENSKVMDAALTVDGIQYTVGDEVKHISFEDLGKK